jgi:arylsulfatase A-like enzyme
MFKNNLLFSPKIKFFGIILTIILVAISGFNAVAQTAKPNVIIIYADDLGYGDISCNYPKNKVKTPNIDKLAQNGLNFKRAYCTGATCTPSRYSLMTGQYAWRKSGTGVLPGDANAIIRSGTTTLPSVFQSAGYQTGVVGKWHLGLGDDAGADWNGEIKQTPNDIGFNYSFIMAATGDRVPTVYVENSRVVGLDPNDPIRVNYKQKVGNDPTGKEHPELLKMGLTHGHDQTIVNGISRIGFMDGGKSARWIDEDMADTFTQKSLDFIEKNKANPFFLYFATQDIHVPRVPHQRFVGKSGMGARGDALLEFDWSVGEIMKILEKYNLIGNTIVILSSDNGPVLDDGYKDDAIEKLGNHKPTGGFRGSKYSIFEAGTRIPLIVHYPSVVKKGKSDALISQVDFLASFASFLNVSALNFEKLDSQNQIEALLGKSKKGRSEVIQHTQVGNIFGINDGKWKYILPSNGKSYVKETNTETGASAEHQLYDLETDPFEKNNLANRNIKKVQELKSKLEAIISDNSKK